MKRLPKRTNGHRQPMHIKIMEKITDLSYPTLFLIWIGMAFGFAGLYWGMEHVPGQGPIDGATGEPVQTFLDALYYSIITATSTGYGDIVPHGFSRTLASLQSIGALFIFAVFVTKLVSHRQDEALQQVHKLTFEDVFHNIREGLFIIRKDCDRLAKVAEEEGKLTEDQWKDLTIAYKQAQTMLEEIPEFYNSDGHLYTIDDMREQLLQEGAQRTLHRINQMLDTFSAYDIDWVNHKESLEALEKLITTVDSVTPKWKEGSPYERAAAFKDILHVNRQIHERVGKALI